MEIIGGIILIIIVNVIYTFIKSVASSSASYNTNVSNPTISLKFSVSVDKKILEFDNEKIDVFTVKIKGLMNNFDTRRIGYFVKIDDLTDESLPVMCTIKGFQTPKTPFFFYSSDFFEVPYLNAILSEEIEMISVPIETLIFPKKGRRKLKITAGVSNQLEQILTQGEVEVYYENPRLGYIDSSENLNLAEELMTKLSIYVSGVDGDFDINEIKIIKEAVDIRSMKSDGTVDTDRKERLNQIIKESIDEARKGINENDIIKLCKRIDEISDVSMKYEIMELLLNIVAVDGVYNEAEYKLIGLISENISINVEKVRAMTEKIIPISIFENVDNPEKILGMPLNLSIQEKKEYLRNEYKKWNQRVTHNDPKIRKQATEMLEIIASERSKLMS